MSGADRGEGAPATRVSAGWIELARSHLRAGRPLRVRAEGGSMAPFLRAGRTVWVRPCAGEVLRRGDVVLYEAGSRLVLHRLRRVEGGWLLPAGDAHRRADGWVRREAVLGRVERRRGDALIARLGPWLARAARGAIRVRRRIFDGPRGRP